MNEPTRPLLRPFAVGIALLVVAVGAKAMHDRSAGARAGVAASLPRDLGREALEPGCAAAPDAEVLLDAAELDPAASGTPPAVVLWADGGFEDASLDVLRAGHVERAALWHEAEVTPQGMSALDLPIAVEVDARGFAELAICLVGPGEPLLLQIALEREGDPRRFTATNALAPLARGWSTVRVPLLRWLDGDGRPWDGAPGSYDLILTLLPLTPAQPDTLVGRFGVSRVSLEGRVPVVEPRGDRAP